MGIDIYVKKDGKDIFFEGLGSGTNFYKMRLAIQHSLENGQRGSRFPILQMTPDSEAEFTMEETCALKSEVETVIREKDNLLKDYKGIPYQELEGVVPKDFTFSRDAIIDRMEVILKGCEMAIISGGTLGWFY